jgi:hypothetical protein
VQELQSIPARNLRAVALAYNWWSWPVRAANPRARREAPKSRPLLLAAVGSAANSGNQTTQQLTPMHTEAELIKAMIANVHAATEHVKTAAEQLPELDRRRTPLTCICQRIVGQIGLPTPPPTLTAPGQLLFGVKRLKSRTPPTRLEH